MLPHEKGFERRDELASRELQHSQIALGCLRLRDLVHSTVVGAQFQRFVRRNFLHCFCHL